MMNDVYETVHHADGENVMRLTPEHIEQLRYKSPEGVYQLIRQFVREECGSVDRDELSEALEDAIAAGLLEERDVRKLEEGW